MIPDLLSIIFNFSFFLTTGNTYRSTVLESVLTFKSVCVLYCTVNHVQLCMYTRSFCAGKRERDGVTWCDGDMGRTCSMYCKFVTVQYWYCTVLYTSCCNMLSSFLTEMVHTAYMSSCNSCTVHKVYIRIPVHSTSTKFPIPTLVTRKLSIKKVLS